jgi:hypothetical protein
VAPQEATQGVQMMLVSRCLYSSLHVAGTLRCNAIGQYRDGSLCNRLLHMKPWHAYTDARAIPVAQAMAVAEKEALVSDSCG